MENIPLPSATKITETGDNTALITIEPLYPGYGATVGNALRRVMLSSMPGAAITAVKIKGVEHEFSTLENVKEDVVEILLNIKKLQFELKGDEPIKATLSVTGAKKVTGKDVKVPSQGTLVNPEQLICTLTDKSSTLEMEFTIQQGRGYVPVEAREKEKLDIGTIAVDAIYTPVRLVNFDTEHVRVGQFTNFDRLKLSVTTSGAITPAEALQQATQILVDHFSKIHELGANPTAEVEAVKEEKAETPVETAEAAEEKEEKPKKKAAKKEDKEA